MVSVCYYSMQRRGVERPHCLSQTALARCAPEGKQKAKVVVVVVVLLLLLLVVVVFGDNSTGVECAGGRGHDDD